MGIITGQSPLRRLRRLPKLMGERLCILLVHNNYHVQRESHRALVGLGHRVVPLVIGQNGRTQRPSANLDLFLNAVVTHRPDMMLTINALAFDLVDWMAEAVDAVGLPTAIWYVDSPFFLAQGFLNPAPAWTTTFSWDSAYVPILSRLGLPHAVHLPLATDLSIFTPPTTPQPPAHPLSFVGNPLVDLAARWQARLTAAERLGSERLQRTLSANRDALPRACATAARPIDRHVVALAAASFEASQKMRLTLLRELPQAPLHVFGATNWASLLPEAHAHPGFAYGRPLAEVFGQTTVNLNVTNLQMPATVNQRVFDVPACGGLLLTDPQAELANFFEPGRDMLTYNCAGEAAELATYYAARPAAAAAIGQRARRRVVAEHTYTHRMHTLLRTMRRHHARGFAA